MYEYIKEYRVNKIGKIHFFCNHKTFNNLMNFLTVKSIFSVSYQLFLLKCTIYLTNYFKKVNNIFYIN